MKSISLLLLLSLVVSLSAAVPEGSFVGVRSFGVGALFGEPTALSAKWNMSGTDSLAFHLGWSFASDGIFGGIDYLFHQPWLPQPWRPYLGIGGRFGIGNDSFWLAGRGLLGIEYLFLNGNLGVGVEMGIGLGIIPEIGLDLSGGLSIRYYF